MKTWLLLVTGVAGLAAASAVQAGNDFVIVASGPRADHRIGPYFPARTSTYAAAVRAFSRPTSRGADGNLCIVRWTRLGLEMDFASSASSPCSTSSLSQSSWFGATVYAGRWRTDRGLGIGDTVTRLRRLYPKATYRDQPPAPPTWILVSVPGEVGPTVYLQAYVWGGRVTALEVPPGNVSVAR